MTNTPTVPYQRKNAFFGLHYDLHPHKDDTVLGADTSEENIARLLDRVRPDYVQYDCKGHAGYTGYPTEIGWASPGIVQDALAIWRKVTREPAEPGAERRQRGGQVVARELVERPRRDLRAALARERPERPRRRRHDPALSAAREIDVPVGSGRAGVRRRSQGTQQAELLEGGLELGAERPPLHALEGPERSLDRGALPRPREVRAQPRAEVARLADVEDGVVAIAACDKTLPGTLMALARLNLPGLLLYGGSIAPGIFEGRDVTILDVFEAVGAHAVGKITNEQLRAVEMVACPGAGACGGQYTANTMGMAAEIMGMSLVDSASVPAMDPKKDEVAVEVGKQEVGSPDELEGERGVQQIGGGHA